MQLTEVFCYALLSMIISSVCVQAERHHELEEKKFDKRLKRREATLLIDSFPTEKIFHKPKVIYRRISKHSYGAPKSKYGAPRPIYGPARATRRPGKKYKGKINAKFGYSNHKKVNKHAYAKRPPHRIAKPNSIYGPIRPMNPYRGVYKHQEPASFGEPPRIVDDYRPTPQFDDYQKPTLSSYPLNQGYGEPPVDSYGAPIKANLHDLTFPTSQTFTEPTAIDDLNSHFDIWKEHQKHIFDNRFASSKRKPAYIKPNFDVDMSDIYVTPLPKDEEEEQNLNSYSDIYTYRQNKETSNKKKKQNFINHVKIMNRPWIGKYSSKIEDEVVVGGQYAEPPARYVSRLQPSGQIGNDDDNEFEPLENHDPEIVSSATNSPYVNYKHSNVAFSPQNLNDAFGIID